MIFRIERSSSFQSVIDIVDPLLLINDPEVIRPKDRPPRSQNRKQMTFDAFTHRKPSQFEKMKMKTNEEMNPVIQRVIERADSVLSRKQGRKQNNEKKRKQPNDAERARTRTITKIKNERI